VQDTYSRFPVVEIVHSTAATPVIAAMDRVMSLYGIPQELGSDNGPPYQSAAMADFSKYMGYEHNHKLPYAPWANGLAENFMRNLKKLMMTCAIEKKNWRQQLQRFLRAYRATPHRSTGFAPATLLFNGRQYRTRLPTVKVQPSAFHEEVQKNDLHAKEVLKKQSDGKAYVKPSEITKGDLVLIRQRKLNKHTSPYDPQPFEVLERKGSMIVARKGQQVVERHMNHCKRFTSETPKDDSKSIRSPEWESSLVSGEEDGDCGSVPATSEPEQQLVPQVHDDAAAVATAGTHSRNLRDRSGLQKPARYHDEFGQ
jgi:hypothetical protein